MPNQVAINKQVGDSLSCLAETLTEMALEVSLAQQHHNRFNILLDKLVGTKEKFSEVAENASEAVISWPKPFTEILGDEKVIANFRDRLNGIKDLRELLTGIPIVFIDKKTLTFFFRGIPVNLQPLTFTYLSILAKRPKAIVKKSEIYEKLWPGEMNYEGTNKPYERQILDNKRKLTAQIGKGIAGKIKINADELKKLIITRTKIGYALNLNKEDVLLLE